jgi:Holliday junction resolvase RusA-like endonuclease
MRQRMIAELLGPPVTKGSKRVFTNRRTGQPLLVEVNAGNLRTWQDALRKSMRQGEPAGWVPLDCAISMTIAVVLTRPKGHFRKNGELSKAGRESIGPTRKPDIDKITRAVFDSGTGIWYRDDAQVIRLNVEKHWADNAPEGVTVFAEELKWGD